MKPAVTILLFAVATLGVVVWFQAASIREQHRELRELNAKLQRKSKTDSLDIQEKCAKQAHEFVKWYGWDEDKSSGFSNHYNDKLKKCFVEFERTDIATGGNTKTVFDAYEGRIYAQYVWVPRRNKKYWEVPPIRCELTLTSGMQTCRTSEEFDELVKTYME